MGAMVGGWYNRGIVVTGDFSGDARFFFFFSPAYFRLVFRIPFPAFLVSPVNLSGNVEK